MKVKISRTIPNRRNEIRPDKNDPEGYPLYPENDDIYGKYIPRMTIYMESIIKRVELILKILQRTKNR